MKVSQIISSYNRPQQLDLLLRSCQDHWPKCEQIFVLWKADNDDFKKGYEKLFEKNIYTNIGFISENNYKINFLSLISSCKNDYILPNSDDNVFINKVAFKAMDALMDEHVAFSMRLGNNINHCLPAKLDLPIPQFQNFKGCDCISWDWTKCDRRGTYGYPQPYDSNIYRKQWLIDRIKDKPFKNPYELENVLNTNRDNSKPFMVSFKEPKLINIMANVTGQNDNPNMKGNGQSLEMLNQKWLDGYQISTKGLYRMKPTQAHIFWDYEFERQ